MCLRKEYVMAKEVSPGVKALRQVVEDVYAEAREAKKQGKPVGWSSSKFPCELAAAFDLKVVYPENQAAGIAANRNGEMLCQAAEDLGYDNDICGYARISLAYAAGYRVGRKFDPETKEFIINPASGKPLKGEDGKPVIDPETGKPKKDPKTQTPFEELVNIHDIEAIEDPEQEAQGTEDADVEEQEEEEQEEEDENVNEPPVVPYEKSEVSMNTDQSVGILLRVRPNIKNFY